jgi:micrococcal nuclease
MMPLPPQPGRPRGVGALMLTRFALRHPLALLAMALLVPGACVATSLPQPPTTTSGAIHDPVVVAVERVVDGDTMDVTGFGPKLERVRFIGVDTPETVKPGVKPQCWGRQASTYTKWLLSPGSTVELRFERDARGRGLRDRYGRLLAYVFKGRLFVNLDLVRRGHAAATYFSPNDDQRDRLKAAETEARTPGKDGKIMGRWAACPSK